MVKYNESLLDLLFKYDAILKKGPRYPKGFKLKSGKHSDIYINMRDTLLIPSLFGSIVAAMEREARNIEIDEKTCFLGVPTMGAVLASILAIRRQAQLAVIRLNQKSYGVGAGVIEGRLTSKIIIVDDVITSGTSVKEIEEAYIKPFFGYNSKNYKLQILVAIDRQEHSYENVISLFNMKDIKKYKSNNTKNCTITGEEI